MPKPRTECPITRDDFEEDAKPCLVAFGPSLKKYAAAVREYSSGSLGWYLNEKIDLQVGDVTVKVQVNCCMTIIGSKDLPRK